MALLANHTPSVPQPPQSGAAFVAVVALVTSAGLMFRATTTGLFGDELLFVRAINLGVIEGLCSPGSSHPPLMRLIVGAFTDSASPDWLFRLPSIVLSTLTVVVWSRVLTRLVLDTKTQCLLLATLSLNPVWINLAFQCLPYAAVTFFASVHCLAWFRLVEKQSKARWTIFVLSGAVLPWIHFFGINALLADLFVWAFLWWKQQVPLRRIVTVNAACLLYTSPSPRD